MAVAFGAAVHGVVFGARHGFQIERVGTLETAHHGRTHFGREIGVFAVSFLSASPARVAEYVDVGCPVGESAVLRDAFSGGKSLVEQRAAFGGGYVAHALQPLRIECRRHGNRLRENGDFLGRARHAVERLIPPVVSRNAEMGNRRRVMLHKIDLFFKREPGKQVGYTLLNRKVGIAERFLCGKRQ